MNEPCPHCPKSGVCFICGMVHVPLPPQFNRDRNEALREEGRREILREIAAMRPQKGQSWCWFCHAHATIDYSLNHDQDCLWLRAVEATRGTEER